MKENSIGDRIEEKYTRYINCETDILELTIEEAIFILEKDVSVHYVEDLLQEAYKVILSDYKRVLKENEILKEEKEQAWEEWNNLEQGSYETEQKIKQQIKKLQKENEELKADNYELNNRINDLLDNISVQKVKDKIEEEIKYHEKNILDIENITMLKGKTAKEEAEIEFNKYVIVVLKKILQELIEEREEK